MQLLLDNVPVNKRTNGHGPVNCGDMVAICRDSLAGVSLACVLLAVTNAATTAAPGRPASVQIPTASADIL